MRQHHLHLLIGAALTVFAHFVVMSTASAGPLAGSRSFNDSASPVENEDTETDDVTIPADPSRSQIQPAGADELVSSYVNSMKRQVLPDLGSNIGQQQGAVDLDGLQGWSLEEISKAMGLLADQTYDETDTVQNVGRDGQDLDLTMSAEDLYNFNAGYYFVVDQQSSDTDRGRLITSERIPDLVGISALGSMDFNTVVQTGNEFNLDMTRRNVMFDTAFFETASQVSTSSRIPGSTRFGSRFSPGGQGYGGASNNTPQTEAIPLAEFIQRVIDAVRENWLNFLFVGVGVSGIVIVATRISA